MALFKIMMGPMSEFAVVLSDKVGDALNEQGYTLIHFLKVFFKSSDVQVVSTQDVRQLRPTTWLFLFLPSSLVPDNLAGLRFKHLVLCDYLDSIILSGYTTDNLSNFRKLACGYLRTAYRRDINYGIPMGTLPLRMPTVLQHQWGIPVKSLARRQFDAIFLGVPTYNSESGVAYHQRVEWLLELVGKCRFFGGLLDSPTYPRADLEAIFGDLSAIYFKGKPLSPFLFSHYLRQSKVALLPTGHSRWTYRHYEAVYAGCVPVSTDVAGIQTFVPLPTAAVMVPDHAPLLPTLRAILADLAGYQDFVNQHLTEMSRWLHRGQFSQKQPEALHRFMAQLDGFLA
ncbi:MAG: hypothetical protein AB7F28_04290 [Candidatus Margulisiibacteriota bacterium]